MVSVAVWEGLLIGGILALGWAGLMLAMFTRSRPFLLLGILSLDTAMYDICRRGYAKTYLWPHAEGWETQSTLFFGHLSLALFAAFVVSIAKQTRSTLPLRRLFVGMGCLEAGLALASVFIPASLIKEISVYTSPAFTLVALIVGILLMRRGTPTGKMMLLVALFGLFTAVLRSLERKGLLPQAFYPAGLDSLEASPVISFIGFLLNLTVLMAWVALVGRQRTEAMQKLAETQAQEAERLEREVKRQTQALHQALEYADEKNRQKTQILGYIGHDLRSPLSTIVGYARLLVQSTGSRHTEYVQAIERSASYQMALIDELLSYARTELKPLALTPSWTPMAQLLGDIVQHAKLLDKQQGNRLTYDVPEALPTVLYLDGRRMLQALLNLLSNATKFTRNGKITLSIRPVEQAAGKWRLRFAVSDTGVGIAPHQQASIFEAFEQVPGTVGGAGLGLYIAQSIVRGLGGELTLNSAEGQGACFSFEVTFESQNDEVFLWQPDADSLLDPHRQANALAAPFLAGAGAVAAFDTPSVPIVQDGQATELPPAHLRLELAILARDGRITDLEQCLRRLAELYPKCAGFINRVQHALDRFELEEIERLSLASAPNG